MKSTDTYNDIKEVNLSYLMLAQNMVRSDREAAIFRLGISEEIADVLHCPDNDCGFTLAVDRHLSLVELLDLPMCSVGFGFCDLDSGEFPEDLDEEERAGAARRGGLCLCGVRHGAPWRGATGYHSPRSDT